MMTPEQYRESLRDGQVTYGQWILDVMAERWLREAIDWVAEGYRFYSPEPDVPHPMWDAPQTAEDLCSRIGMLRQSDITADAFGGWELVTKKMMSGNGMCAQRLVTRLQLRHRGSQSFSP